jgi:hypothetical protein
LGENLTCLAVVSLLSLSTKDNGAYEKTGAVIPAWNEEQDISLVLNTVGLVKWLSEIVVIDDGSIDNTLVGARKYRSICSYACWTAARE